MMQLHAHTTKLGQISSHVRLHAVHPSRTHSVHPCDSRGFGQRSPVSRGGDRAQLLSRAQRLELTIIFFRHGFLLNRATGFGVVPVLRGVSFRSTQMTQQFRVLTMFLSPVRVRFPLKQVRTGAIGRVGRKCMNKRLSHLIENQHSWEFFSFIFPF